MKAIIKNIINCAWLLLLTIGISYGQDTLELRRIANPTGGKWSSSGTFTTFTSIGQVAASTMLSSDTLDWSGNVGFIGPIDRVGKNNAPLAIAPNFELFLRQDDLIILRGFDPDGDEIAIEVLEGPKNGELVSNPSGFGRYDFKPGEGISPEVIYRDSIVFRVVEVNSDLVSEPEIFRFKFRIKDTPHQINDVSFTKVDESSAGLTIGWADDVFNKNYRLRVDYFDLSDPTNRSIESLSDESQPLSVFEQEGNLLTYTIGVSAENDPYIFNAQKVFVTVLITTPNGNSDFSTYIIDNTDGGRIEASEDGLFFAYGSEMTVTENGSVKLSLVGVELGDFSLTNSTVEIIEEGSEGTITVPVEKSSTANTKTWNVSYTSTKEVGGDDQISFRIYSPERQLFDTAYAQINIVGVNDPPQIVPIGDQLTQEGNVVEIPLMVEDPDNEVSIAVESNEATLVPVSYANGVITVTPDGDFSGQVAINVVVSEENTEEAYVAFESFNMDITPVNDSPVVTAISDQSIDEDNVITLVLSATDVDAELPVFDFTATSDDPSKITLTIDGNNLTVQPNEHVNGVFTISVFADDRQGKSSSKSDAEVFVLNINEVNDAPLLVNNFKTQRVVPGNENYKVDLSAYFFDVENGTDLAYSASGNTQLEVSFDGSLMNVSIPSGFVDFEDVTLNASDGELQVSAVVTFVPVVQSPDITIANVIGSVTLDEDFGVHTIDASGVFVDNNNAEAQFEYEISGNNFISAIVDASGLITLTSKANFFGNESLILIGSTGNQSNFTTFDLQVNGVNDAPKVQSVETQLMQEDITKSNIYVEVSDADDDFSALTLSVASSEETIISSTDISFTQTVGGYLLDLKPIENAFGELTVSATVSDDDGAQATTTFNVNVQAVNDEPIVTVSTLEAAVEDEEFSLSLSSLFSDADEDVLSFSVSQKPNWVTLTSGVLTGTPLNDDVGNSTLIISANDGNGGQSSVSYSLEVENTNDAPVVAQELGDIAVFQENTWEFNFPKSSFSDVDASDELTFSFEEIPSWASVSGEIVSGTPQYEDIGEHTLSMKATDIAGESVMQEVKVLVSFTVYDVEISLNVPDECANGSYEVSASGAVTFNWYDSDDQLIFEDVSTVTLTGGSTYFVEGVDAEGRATPTKESFELNICLGTKDLDAIAIYPNPAQHYIHISNMVDQASIKITDITGRRFEVSPYEAGENYQISIRHIPNGMYFVEYEVSGELKTSKLIKK